MKPHRIILTAVLSAALLCCNLQAQSTTERPGRTKWQSHMPANLDKYVPEPIEFEPNPQSGTIEPYSSDFENRLVRYDMLTGTETVLDFEKDAPEVTMTNGSPGVGDESSAGGLNLFAFTQLAQVTNPQDIPWRSNCKLFYSKGNGYYSATGVLIDPLHVITAGHCVHQGNGGDWVSDMIVIPGYQDEIMPYGDAFGVSLYTWTGWKNQGSSDDDIGLIKLDRPIGAITGWYGYSYNNNLNFYIGNNFQSAGYPGAPPYDGELMYFWQGNFDYAEYDFATGRWAGNEVAFAPAAYSGQSGSGVCRVAGFDRVIYAIVSNTYSGFTFCPRITSGKYRDIMEFIDANTPTSFDLMPLGVEAAPRSIQAGEPLTSAGFTIHNYSSVPWSGTINADIYLSSDDDISASDVLLGSETFSQSLSSKESRQIELQSPLSIPAETAKGQYWIGVILDVADYDIVNNDSDGQEAARIVVGADWLENNQPETFSDTSKEFALTINGIDWSCIAIRPSDNQDIEIDMFPDFSLPYGISAEDGTACDFIAVNGHWLGDSVHYARLLNGAADSSYTIEAQWHIPDIYLGTVYGDLINSDEIIQMYEVPLYSGQRCRFNVDVTSGDADLSLYAIKAYNGWGSRTYSDGMANQSGPGEDESILITSDFTGYYAIIVVNENAGSAYYTITAEEN
jgi:V8-like Glu-specific endopeptidase